MPIVQISDVTAFDLPNEPLRETFFAVNFPSDLVQFDQRLVEYVSEQPHWSLTTNKQFQGPRIAHYADKKSLESFTIGFWEDTLETIRGFFFDWFDQIIDSNGYYGLPSDYLKPLSIETLDNDNNIIRTNQYSGVMPVKISGFKHNYSSDNFVKPSITFVAASPDAGSVGDLTGLAQSFGSNLNRIFV